MSFIAIVALIVQRLTRSCRCIIPADGFYESRKEGRRKVPMWMHLRNREPFGMAGLWDVWRKPDGKRVESFTIITTSLMNCSGRFTTVCR